MRICQSKDIIYKSEYKKRNVKGQFPEKRLLDKIIFDVFT